MNECPLYAEPELYDLLFPGATAGGDAVRDRARRERIIASERFYVDQARKAGGRVLEMACGSGRLTVPIAQQGIEITGADLSASMLEAARAKARSVGVNVPFIEADMRSFHFAREFDGIFIPGNSLLHLLSASDWRKCFASVRRHLTPKGRFVFDISHWDPRTYTEVRHPVLQLAHPERGEVTIEEAATYDSREQVRRITWFLSAPGAADFRTMEYALRVMPPDELEQFLEASGFRLETRYGEFTLEPFSGSSPRQVCICAAR